MQRRCTPLHGNNPACAALNFFFPAVSYLYGPWLPATPSCRLAEHAAGTAFMMKKILLLLAILVLPVHFLVDGFGSLMPGKAVASTVAATHCTPGADASPGCAEDDPLEISATADASDYLPREIVPGQARALVAGFTQARLPFPASFYPLTGSPPPRG